MIKIYGTKNCRYCGIAKEYFSSKELPFEYIDVGEDLDKRKIMVETYKTMSVPVIVINDKPIMG